MMLPFLLQAAHCCIHIAGLVAQYLKIKGIPLPSLSLASLLALPPLSPLLFFLRHPFLLPSSSFLSLVQPCTNDTNKHRFNHGTVFLQIDTTLK